MATLKTDYKESEFATGITNKHLAVSYNSDANNSVSFNDVTTYKTQGDYINATQINVTNAEINSLASRYSAWISSYTPCPTNLQNATFTGRKKFIMTDIGGGEVTLQDVTSYIQSGSTFDADIINNANTILNNLDTAYNAGYLMILNFLKQNGAKSNDLLTAFTEMETYNSNLGYNTGIDEASNDPHSYGLYRLSEYNALVQENAVLKSKIDPVKSRIANYRSSLYTTWQNFYQGVLALQQNMSAISPGMSLVSAVDIADDTARNGTQLELNEDIAYSDYKRQCDSFITDLG